MKSILHTLFSDVRAQVLLHLFSERPREYYVRELARGTTVTLRTVQKELAKLSAADLVGTVLTGTIATTAPIRNIAFFQFFRSS